MSIRQIFCHHKWAALSAYVNCYESDHLHNYVCDVERPYVCMKCNKISFSKINYQSFDTRTRRDDYAKELYDTYPNIKPYIEIKDLIDQHKRGIPDICALQSK